MVTNYCIGFEADSPGQPLNLSSSQLKDCSKEGALKIL